MFCRDDDDGELSASVVRVWRVQVTVLYHTERGAGESRALPTVDYEDTYEDGYGAPTALSVS